MAKRNSRLPGHVILYHITHRANLRSIYRSGLLMEKSLGLQRVWLCDADHLLQIRKHLCKHHRWTQEELITFEVRIEETLIHRFREGVFHVYYDLPPSWLLLMKPNYPAAQ